VDSCITVGPVLACLCHADDFPYR